MNNKKIVIIDSDIGNVGSVKRAVQHFGYHAVVSNKHEDINSASHLILPGVGSFDLLATKGYENNKETNGLNIIPGIVKKLKKNSEFKLPHIGWNQIIIKKKRKIFKNVLDNSDFYFIHSYEFICEDELNNIGISNYCSEFTSIINQNNVYGVQFHPEKSLEQGLQIIKNFLEI